MLCEKCNENEATFHYTEVVNGIMTQHHLCSECAAKMGLTGFAESPSADFPFARLLTGLLAASNRSTQEQDNPMMNVKCPKCGMKYQEFIRIGKFGCADCYDVFGPLIEDNIKTLHGSVEHKGKKSNKTAQHGNDLLDEIAVLNAKLKEAVELDNFEDAAHYRDEIKKLKEGGGNA